MSNPPARFALTAAPMNVVFRERFGVVAYTLERGIEGVDLVIRAEMRIEGVARADPTNAVANGGGSGSEAGAAVDGGGGRAGSSWSSISSTEIDERWLGGPAPGCGHVGGGGAVPAPSPPRVRRWPSGVLRAPAP